MTVPILNAWMVSPYSAKTRAHLEFLGIDVVERVPSMLRLSRTIRKAVGQAIMPTVQLPDGRWLQDSSAIYDHFERESNLKTMPSDARQQMAAYLLEVQADEWLCLAALHYRWSNPVNVNFALNEFARDGFPFLPRKLGRIAASKVADRMRGYLPKLGVDSTTAPALEAHTMAVLTALEEHLSRRPFIFGTRPSLADFSLYGPLWAHLYRDPGTTDLFDDFERVRSWMNRLTRCSGDLGEFETDYADTLDPLLVLCSDQWRYLATLLDAIERYVDENPSAERVPRALGTAPFTLGTASGERKLITFAQWKAQRAMDCYSQQPDPETAQWLADLGLATVTRPVRHRLERVDFKMTLRRGEKAS